MTSTETVGISDQGGRFIFVGGPPRSGTTLIQNVLDSHPRICGGPEFLHLSDMIDLRRKLRHSVDRGWIDIYCSRAGVDQHIRSLIEAFLTPILREYDAEFLSEKTPANVLIFSELMELFPAARFVFVVRDPRAIVSSLLAVGRRGEAQGWETGEFTRSVPAAVDYVQRCLDAGFEALKSAPGRVLAVAYERFVSETENETKRICDFLGLGWSEAMLRPASQRHPGEAAIVNDVWYDRDSFHRDPVTTEIDKWKWELAGRHQIAVSRAFRDHRALNELGYDLTPRSLDGLSPPKRAIAHLSDSALSLARRAARAPRRLVRFVQNKRRQLAAGGPQ